MNRNHENISSAAARILRAWFQRNDLELRTELAQADVICRTHPCRSTLEQEQLEILDSVVQYLAKDSGRSGDTPDARSAAVTLLRALA